MRSIKDAGSVRGVRLIAVRRSLLAGAVLCALSLLLGSASAGAATAAQARPARQVLAAGEVEHWGSYFGDQNPSDNDRVIVPASVTLPGQVAEIGTSNSTEYALLTDGALYAWGQGTHGELGNGSEHNSFATPVQVRFPAGVRIASIPADVMPFDTGLAVNTQGRAWGWGLNEGGELCLGNTRTYTTPVELPLSGVSALAGASGHALYDSDGTVYACGTNHDGELGDGSTHPSSTPVQVRGLDGGQVTALVAAFNNSGALLADGAYLDWGWDGQGQLGDGTTGQTATAPVQVNLPGPVSQVAQGGSMATNGHTLVLLANGSLRAWGDDSFYQLGDGNNEAEASPVPFFPPAGVTYQSLATGGDTSYAISPSGDVYAWGAGNVGQLGDGRTRTARTPVQVINGAGLISSTASDVTVSTR